MQVLNYLFIVEYVTTIFCVMFLGQEFESNQDNLKYQYLIQLSF